jgi:hypothetical protein
MAKKTQITGIQSRLLMVAAGSIALLTVSGCAATNPSTPVIVDSPVASSASAETAASGDHLAVAEKFKPSEGWSLIKESDRTKKDGTKIHHKKWDTGSQLPTVDDIRGVFEDNGFTVTQCYEGINNCTGTAADGSVEISMTATRWTNEKTGEFDHNDITLETMSR